LHNFVLLPALASTGAIPTPILATLFGSKLYELDTAIGVLAQHSEQRRAWEAIRTACTSVPTI
jgi:hypothetical protein